MKLIWILIFFNLTVFSHGLVVNSIIANVGKYSITKYDLQKMDEFLRINGVTNGAFQELLSTYSMFTLVENDEKIIFKEKEVDTYISAITNAKSTNDPSIKTRLKIYQEFPDQFRMQVKKSQIIRSMAFYKEEIKNKSDEEIPNKDLNDFYKKNKKYFTEPPVLDLYIVSVPQPKDLNLSQLENFEKNLMVLADALKKSDDITPLLNNYRKIINPEPYSGRTGTKSVYELYNSGYPEELLSISLMTNIPNAKVPIKIKNGTVLGPEVINFRNSPDKMHYLILKIISRKPVHQSTFEEARPLLENLLKEERIKKIIQQYIIDKINNGEISISIIDKSYEGAYDEYIRR